MTCVSRNHQRPGSGSDSGPGYGHQADVVVAAVHSLKPDSRLGPWDFVPYAEGIAVSEVWGMYARVEWN